MTKRIFAAFLSLVMVCSLIPISTGKKAQASQSWDGTTKAEPCKNADGVFQIGTAEELAWFADYVNETAKANSTADNNMPVSDSAELTADIDLGGEEWTPICTQSYVAYCYAETFDGKRHKITGLKIEATAANYGLFGIVNGATIKNLKVEGRMSSTKVCGGLIGKLQKGTVENCSMSGSVVSTGGYAGGLIGTIGTKDALIRHCSNRASVTGTYAGGILGFNKNKATIAYCYNTGTITGTTRSGGIAGQQNSGAIQYCYSIGESTNGIAGFSNATIDHCYYLAEKTQDTASPAGGTATGYQVITDAATLLVDLTSDPESLYVEDSANQNIGYPMLAWEIETDASPVPVKTVEIEGESVTGNKLVAKAIGEEDKAATSVTYQWGISEDGITYMDLRGETNSAYTIPDETDYAGKYIKVTVFGEKVEEKVSTASQVSGPISKSDTLIARENTNQVAAAKASLVLSDTIFKRAQQIALPDTYMGCDISWSSNNTDIVSDTGQVSLPASNIVSVTLTATIQCGEAVDTKDFVVEVWSENIEPLYYLENAKKSLSVSSLQPVPGEDTNLLIKIQKKLKEKGYDGIAVTITSTEDDTLVSQNGKISYPKLPSGGSFADGKQVKVQFAFSLGDQTVTFPDAIYSFLIPWDLQEVEKDFEKSADYILSENNLLGDNVSFEQIEKDMTLPSCVDDAVLQPKYGKKYSFAWITWTSSDETHFRVSNENREAGADSMYHAYVGKVQADDKQHEITITATVKNPATDYTFHRVFHIIVAPMSAETLANTEATMQKILSCYTSDKLMDYTTKSSLNVAAVKHDIQLVLPQNVVTGTELSTLDYGAYWDYWNYKFELSSSDPNVIEVNGFRAYVYRPIGESVSADKLVTLTVTMTNKKNTNLKVSKDIQVTVSHLTRKEMNQALELMDMAKDAYADGLLNQNADAYSIIDDLSPYQEIAWNDTRSGVTFIYDNVQRKNTGIVVDELPGWDGQEDYRLFRSSDKDIITNETLKLAQTPAANKFVKIDSVLTDEEFGKYYTKFVGDSNYDAEALLKFKQLYKQPVEAYFLVLGNGAYTSTYQLQSYSEKKASLQTELIEYQKSVNEALKVSLTVLGFQGQKIVEKTEDSTLLKGTTVFSLFKKVLDEKSIAYETRGSYIVSIAGLAEFDKGANSGWMYSVDGVFVNSYMSAQQLRDGDEIVVRYVSDYRKANQNQDSEDNPGSGSTSAGSGCGSGAGSSSSSTTEPNKPDDPNIEDDQGQDNEKEDDKNKTENPSGDKTDDSASSEDKTDDSASSEGNAGHEENSNQQQNLQENPKQPTKQPEKKLAIKTLKLTKWKKNSKAIKGKTLANAKVIIKVGSNKYTVKANKKGVFQIKLKKKLKKKQKVIVKISLKGYKTKKQIFKVK